MPEGGRTVAEARARAGLAQAVRAGLLVVAAGALADLHARGALRLPAEAGAPPAGANGSWAGRGGEEAGAAWEVRPGPGRRTQGGVSHPETPPPPRPPDEKKTTRRATAGRPGP